MKKILMTLVLAPVMALAGEPAAVTNTCDTTQNPPPHENCAISRQAVNSNPQPKSNIARLRSLRTIRQQTVNGYTLMYSVWNGEAVIGSGLRSTQKAISPEPTGHFSIPSILDGNKVICIGRIAFRNCGEMTSVTIPEGVTAIGQSAFEKCGKLTTIEIPSTVTKIDCTAFSGCDELRQINVSTGNQWYASVDGVLYSKDMTELLRCPAGVASVAIPKSVTFIRNEAFVGCRRMTKVTIPSDVTEIDILAFQGCTGLTSVKIPQKVYYIGHLAFAACDGLTSLAMCGVRPVAPDGVFGRQARDLGKRTDWHFCPNLKAIHVPANSKSWAGLKEWQGIPLVFDGDPIDPQKEKELLDVVQQESAWQERNRAGLRKKIQAFQEKFKRIKAEKAAAANCATNSPAEEKNVMAERLAKCIYLLNGEFKRNAKVYICLFATTECGASRSELQRIAKTYADNLKDDPNIEFVEFSLDRDEKRALDWAKAHDVKFPVVKPTSFEIVDLPVFALPHLFIVRADGVILEDGHPASTFTVAKLRDLKAGRLMPRDRKAEVEDGKKEAVVDGHTWSFTVQNGEATIGALCRPKMLGGSCAVSPSPVGDITIPSVLGGVKVTGIGRSAFKGCGELKSVTIPPSIWDIDGWPFHGCNKLESVTIQSDVIRLSEGCLSGCAGLKQINVEADNRVYASFEGLLYTKDRTELVQCPAAISSVEFQKEVTSIGNYAFNGCRQLRAVTLPSHTKNIGLCAFCQCAGLKTITIPSNVRYIGGGAFAECVGLTTVVMQGDCPSSPNDVFVNCANLKSIHVPASSKSWAGMKEWQGIPLVFDAE